jgi:CBS domain containing-hemolysin-like protein
VDGQPEALTTGSIVLRLLAVLLLVLLNGFFVAAEFALVGVRRSRIEALEAKGDRTARVIRETLDRINYYIAAAQLGITVASLALGWIGEAALATLVDSVLGRFGVGSPSAVDHTVAAIVTAFLLLTFLHIVMGEQAPKTVAIMTPERLSRIIVRPLRWFAKVTSPFTALLNWSSNGLVRLLGFRPGEEMEHVHSAEELRLLVAQSHKGGELDQSDRDMLAGVFDLHKKKIRDVMRPRTEIVAVSIDATENEVRDTVRRERYSRYPVYKESLDDVVGVFLAKDYMFYDGGTPFSLASVVREALFVPDSRPAERVIDDLRKTRAHMAVVLDEYGGTAGIVTMEDLVEEVIGDIADEYDLATRSAMMSDGVLELAGVMSLIDVRSDHNIPIPEGSWSTLGGYVFSRLGRLPRVGDRVTFPGGELEVVAMDGRRVAALRVHRTPAGAGTAA